MKIIITGGTGLIGRALSKRLAQDGDEIVILSRSSKRPDGLVPEARIVQWDSQTGEGWSHELADTDAIVNLAGDSIGSERWSEAKKQRVYDSRINAGRAIVDAVNKAGTAPARLIQASGVNYYGHRSDKYLTEDEPAGNDFLSKVCIDWEASTEPLEAFGTSRALIRNAIVLDGNEGALPLMAMPFKFFVGGPIASGKQGVSWIHIRDHIEALRFLLKESDLAGPINLSAPNPASNRQFSKAIGKALGRPSFMPAPGFALRAAVGEFANHLIYGQYVVPHRLLEAGFEFKFPDVEPALKDLLG
ncbi:MAG: TIGR01777 family protein [Sphaerobacteraceae bacterium]|nr:MAG: TIGR01777 family protein [Sphaerobacteraceae bacterium]